MSQSTPKTVLITGASAGIGKATAELFLERGFRVFVAARRVERMADLEAKGATAIAMDITREEDVQAAVAQITERAGGVDILVNNAGFGLYGAVEDTTIDDARYQFEVNLFGLARLTQLVLPHMREQRWGRVINISSVGGRIYTPLGAWYHATKHALEGWSDALRLEVAGFGIGVSVVRPGLIETEFGDVMSGPMLERSGSTAYGELARQVAKGSADQYAPGAGTPPGAIGQLVLKAATARTPRTRYAGGKWARPLLFLRWLLPPALFDRVIMAAV